MSSTQDDLNSFHQFAVECLAAGDQTTPLDELFLLWFVCRVCVAVFGAIRRG